MRRLLSLKEISFRYNFPLIDTCAFTSFFNEKRLINSQRAKCLKKVTGLLEEDVVFYTTKFIFEEIGNSDYCMTLLGERETDVFNETKRLCTGLKTKKRIITLTPAEENLTENFSKELSISKYEINSSDKNLFLTGLVLSKTRCPAAIITNDKGLFLSWKDYYLEYPDQFGCFIRKDIDSFGFLF